MITYAQDLKATPKQQDHSETLRELSPHLAPSVSPAKTVRHIIRHIKCDGEPPIEAVRNSGFC
jgi:hypothetical protein